MNNEKHDSVILDVEIALSEFDLNDLAKQITDLDGEIDTAENEMEILKAEVSTIKKGIEAKDGERRKMSRDYARGKALRTFTAYYIDSETHRRWFEVGTDKVLKDEPLPKNVEMF